MTAYSYQEWNSLSQDQQSRSPGVSIPRDHALNNPNRGVYWNSQSSALALATNIQDVLTGPDREGADRMWRQLKLTHRRAVESPKAIGRAMTVRQLDANRALESSAFSLNDEQTEQLQSAADDIVRIQDQAELAGLDPVRTAQAMINRASAEAVGFAPPRQVNQQFSGYLNSPEGVESQESLNQSVRQLYSLIRTGEIDALDRVENLSDRNLGEDATRADEMEFMRSLMGSIPLERNPIAIEASENFSVRMDTGEEARAMEIVLKWAGQHEELPAPEQVHEAFNSWRDSALVASPFEARENNRIGLIVGSGSTAASVSRDIIAGFGDDANKDTQIVLLTTENDSLSNATDISGRPVVAGRARAGLEGIGIEGLEDAPKGAVVVMNLTREQATDPVQRSLAANSLVGATYAVGYVAGTHMQPLEAQAIHLAGSARKLTIAVDNSGNEISNEKMPELREAARELDKNADPNRYYAAGLARPRGGVTAVAFDGARNYDAATRKYAPGRDPMNEGYGRIPRHAAILTLDNPAMASYKWLDANARNRPVLYAEAERKLSFAQDVSAGLDGEKVMAREAGTELTIYDRPRNQRTGSPDEKVDWQDPRVRGAIVLVRGNATNEALNAGAQATKIAQEAIVDHAHSGIIFDDMQKDFHAAHLTRLALEMGKRFTVVGKEGDTVPLAEAREVTRRNAQSFTEIADIEINQRFHGSLSGLDVAPADIARAERGRRNVAYSLSDDVGQLTLAGLPGMDAQKASKLAHLPLTLEEVFMSKDPEVKKSLYQAGMPSDTIKRLDDRKVWQKAVEGALMNANAANALDSQFVPAGTDSRLPENRSGFVFGPDHGRPVMAFIGNAAPTYDGVGGKYVPADELVDRKQLSEAIRTATAKGYAIATTFEEGVGKAVLEEAAKIPEAKVIVATSGNPMANSPEMRMTLRTLLEQDQASVLMPTAIAGHRYETRDGVSGTRFADIRSAMHDIVSHVADVGVVVQASAGDQALHMVDKMNAQSKPVAVMIPENTELASTEAYRGNLKLARGAGRTSIESISMASVPSAQGYANITDEDTEMKLMDGVLRGNAGTFQSVRLARSDMARSGHHYKEMGWGSAARVLTDGVSVERFAESHQKGTLEPLGQYVGKTARELEKRSVERYEMSESTREMFADQQKRHTAHIMDEAAKSMSM